MNVLIGSSHAMANNSWRVPELISYQWSNQTDATIQHRNYSMAVSLNKSEPFNILTSKFNISLNRILALKALKQATKMDVSASRFYVMSTSEQTLACVCTFLHSFNGR